MTDNTYRTETGKVLTDADIEALAEEVATAEYDIEVLKRRTRGRPLLGSAPAEVVPVRLDPDLRAAVEARAEADDTNSSEVIRRALRAYLDPDPLKEFIGIGASGDSEPFDTRNARSAAAKNKLARGT